MTETSSHLFEGYYSCLYDKDSKSWKIVSSWQRLGYVPISWAGEDWTDSGTKRACSGKAVLQTEMGCCCRDEGKCLRGRTEPKPNPKPCKCPLQSLKNKRDDSSNTQMTLHITCLRADIPMN